MTVADDWRLVLGVLEDVGAGRPMSFADADRAYTAATRLKAKYQGWLDGCARATDLANKARAAHEAGHGEFDGIARGGPEKIREALGVAYLGGPIL